MGSLVFHTIEPVYDKNSRVLILGTMPSPKSRELGFYYSHPQNNFWRVISKVFDKETPADNNEKTAFLLKHNIALWDVLKSCTIDGADDTSIKNPVPNDISMILNEADIKAVFTTGKKATRLYNKLCYPVTKMETVYLPSTSPANCRFYSFDDLVGEYEVIKKL